MLKTKLRVAVAEDDNSTRKYIKDLLSKIDNVELIGDVANGNELIELVKNTDPDILFVDIEMPEIDGRTAVSRVIELGHNPYIIFLTGHNEFALDAFELSAIDYIVKPVRMSRLLKTFKKIYDLQEKSQQQMAEIKNILTSRDKIFIKTGSSVTFIDVDSIIMIERKNNKSIILTQDNKYETTENLMSLKNKLDFPQFFQSHKSFIVNLKHISQINPIGNRAYEIRFQQSPNTALISRLNAKTIFSLLNIPYNS
ncbi:LytR/AlgR family response regulator transcription factor [Desulfolucanica intricata]|uniref:LytR/AlgR family response regulator transcription factor n=1 Tax=Desulfolucanica intricata TaxID=1285191 RepID=UPI00082DAD49|nr:LytTR family DNA-binding domain-containing protein [Desulfolucanica intricata]